MFFNGRGSRGKEVKEMQEFLRQNEEILRAAREKAGIDPEKIQETVSGYLQIARDNQLNYNELQYAFTLTKELVLQSLNKVAISTYCQISHHNDTSNLTEEIAEKLAEAIERTIDEVSHIPQE